MIPDSGANGENSTEREVRGVSTGCLGCAASVVRAANWTDLQFSFAVRTFVTTANRIVDATGERQHPSGIGPARAKEIGKPNERPKERDADGEEGRLKK